MSAARSRSSHDPAGSVDRAPRARVEVRRVDGLDEGDSIHSIEDALFREIVRLCDAGESAALAIVIGVQGSAPAREPMKILVRADGTTLGSVGGGCLEEEVKRRAQQVIDEERPARVTMTLTDAETPGGALICGGRVEVYVEPITAPSLVIFGGGHVSKAVALLAARAGFRITVSDDRPEYASATRFPMAAQTRVEFPDVAARTAAIDRSSFVLVMTRTHADDRQILLELWKRQLQPRYLGMIGSGTRRGSRSTSWWPRGSTATGCGACGPRSGCASARAPPTRSPSRSSPR
jgi:xanthine dehydrogenase accessory factor